MIIPLGYSYVQWRLLCDGDSEEMLTGMGYEWTDTAPDDSERQAAAALFAPVMQVLTSEYTLRGARIVQGSDGPDLIYNVDATTVVAGAQTPGVAPPNVAYLVRKQTGLGGRRNRGRMYIPGPPRNWFSAAGIFGTTQLASAQTAVEELLDPSTLALAGFSNAVLFHSTGVTPTPSTPTPITSLSVQSKVATQRRRLRP